ncbi:MAG: hypothetical protein RL021_1190 [Bacteroidota bacterium]|jgi:hypothetical protein
MNSLLRLTTVTLFTITLALSAKAQGDGWKDPGYDTSYILSFRDNLVVTLVATTCGNEISATDTTGKTLTFSTNLPTSFGFGLDYKWLTFEYASSFGKTGVPEKGYTQMKSLGFGLTGRKFWFRNFYQNTQGYYLKNPQFLNPDFNPATDTYPLRGDVSTSVYFATLNYGFNYRRFSNIAALWQLERQKKSAGSFTAGLSFSTATHRSDSALFPEQFEKRFNQDDAITRFDFTMYGINCGYLHTFSFTKSRKYFITLSFIPGISYQNGAAVVEDSGQRYEKNALGLHSEARFATGYNGDRWYASMMSVAYLVSSTFEGTNPLAQGYTFGRIAVGYKFTMKETTSPFLKRIGL